ncbi:uncharacterized protein AB675_10526 [Cyphellophora attinorum]|uniref:Uncharacterized protein n=1 Tax=Cyphellophora attinorum TaxID=1664694 RepID=A0A0N1H362_9EURO|nr:uncharacterized protein AB675_10526 [Phialophora attinorum]KPI35910.1 hypothetical protein AB675_10526 [Phialophora attinorum]
MLPYPHPPQAHAVYMGGGAGGDAGGMGGGAGGMGGGAAGSKPAAPAATTGGMVKGYTGAAGKVQGSAAVLIVALAAAIAL